jgi:hypothetical protein
VHCIPRQLQPVWVPGTFYNLWHTDNYHQNTHAQRIGMVNSGL